MSLIEKIDADFKQALLKKNEATVGVLRLLKTAIKNKAIEMKKELEDADIVLILKSEVKKRKEAAQAYQKGERDDLADKEKAEAKILQQYLPKQLSAAELENKVKQIIDSLPDEQKENFGQAMKAVMLQLKGVADGQIVSQMVKNIIQK